MSHDTPKTTKALYDLLSGTLDVTVMNVGSSEGMSPQCPADLYPNLYYTGCWREAMYRFGNYDVLWMIGGDVTAQNSASEYKCAIETAMPFGLWSPVIEGYCREIMHKHRAGGKVWNVYHLEGIATAISLDMMRQITWDIPPGSKLGWGVDLWMSWFGWSTMQRNILDGRVAFQHPESCGYSRQEALAEMGGFMENAVGVNWHADARLAPQFGSFQANLREMVTI